MKSKILTTLTAALTSVAMLTACGDDSSSSANGENGGAAGNGKYIHAAAAQDNIFIGIVSLDNTQDVGKDYIEVGNRAGAAYFDGSAFIMDLDVGSITRYAIEGDKIGKKEGSITLAGAWAAHLFFVDKEKGYIAGMMDSLVIFNPKTMKVTGSINLAKYKDKTATSVTPSTGVIVDGLLYIGLLQNQSEYATGDVAQVAIIDVEKDEVIAVAKDDRVAAVGSLDDSENHAFIVVDNYIYTYSNASWGYGPGQKDGFLRIKVGEKEFDKGYVWNISDEVEIKDLTKKGVFKYLAPFSNNEGSVVYSFLNVMEDLKKSWTSEEDYYNPTCKPVQLDLAKKTIKALPIDLSSSWASFGKVIENDGTVVFAVSTKDGNAYYRYNPKDDTAEKIADVDLIPMWLVPLE